MNHQINLAPDTPTLVAEHLPALAESYLADCALRNKPITVGSYRYALSFLLRWWAEQGPVQNWLLTKKELVVFAKWLEVQPGQHAGELLAYNSRDMILSRIRQMFHWAAVNNYIDRDFGVFVPAASGEPPIRQSTTVTALQKLLNAARQSRHPHRDCAIIAVFIGTAIRRAECSNLNVQDVILHADNAGRLLIRKTKTDDPRVVVFDRQTGGYLVAHLNALGANEGPLFPSQLGGRLTPKGVYAVVKDAVERAGLAAEIQGPHDLRRMFVTLWMRNRKGLSSAQLLSMQAGHTSAKMTLQYSLQNVDDLEQEFFSPMQLMGQGG